MSEIIANAGFPEAVTLLVLLSAIPLGTSMLVGLIVSVLQAATQIQEQTLTFVPKLVTICAVLFVAGPWMVRQLVEYFSDLLQNIAHVSIAT